MACATIAKVNTSMDAVMASRTVFAVRFGLRVLFPDCIVKQMVEIAELTHASLVFVMTTKIHGRKVIVSSLTLLFVPAVVLVVVMA